MWSQVSCLGLTKLSHYCRSVDEKGFPCGTAGKESACNTGDLGSIPGLGRSPGEGKGYTLQYSGLENTTDCIVHGVTKSWTWLSLSLGFLCGSTSKESACTAGDLGSIPGLGRSLGEGKGYPLQYSSLENTMDDCIVHGVGKSWTRLSNFHIHVDGEVVLKKYIRKFSCSPLCLMMTFVF